MPKKPTASKAKQDALNKARGLRMKAIREGKKMSQEEVATGAGISTKTVYRYEDGDKPKLDILANIAVALGVELKAIL